MSQDDARSATRFKILSLLLGGVCAFLLWRGPSPPDAPELVEKSVGSSLPATRAMALRQLRKSAARFGPSEATLLAELRDATSVARIDIICERLAFVGTDRAVDVLTDFAGDRRTGVAKAALVALGRIGTDSAVRFLIGFEQSGIPRHRGAAIGALGHSQSKGARDRLLEIALTADDSERSSAVRALGDHGGSKEVVSTFATLAESGADDYTTRAVIRSLSQMDRDDARALLATLATSKDPRVAAYAIDYLEFSPKSETRELLVQALGSPFPNVAGIAAKTLARQGDNTTLPMIIELARGGQRDAQLDAIAAIGILEGDGSSDALSEFLSSGDHRVRSVAADALAEVGDEEAVEMLIEATSHRGSQEAAVSALRDLRGDAVEDAMIAVAKSGLPTARRNARQYLLDVRNPEGLELVIETAKRGVGRDRSDAISVLADIGSPRARESLREIAAQASGDARMESIAALVAMGEVDATKDMLRASLLSGDDGERYAAAATLAKIGDARSREALIDALKSGHGPTARAAAAVALEAGRGDDIREALFDAARSDREVRSEVIERFLDDGDDQGLELARAALTDTETVRETAWALARTDHPDALAVLIEGAHADDPELRAQIAGTLSMSEDSAATGALTELASDESDDVRAAALQSLGEIGSEEALTSLTSIAEEADPIDRRRAVEALGASESRAAREKVAAYMISSDDSIAIAAISSNANGNLIAKTLVTVLNDLTRSEIVRAAAARKLQSLGVRVSESQQAEIKRLLES